MMLIVLLAPSVTSVKSSSADVGVGVGVGVDDVTPGEGVVKGQSFPETILSPPSPSLNLLDDREYMADLETKLAKAGSKVVKLDADGNVATASAAASSNNAMNK